MKFHSEILCWFETVKPQHMPVLSSMEFSPSCLPAMLLSSFPCVGNSCDQVSFQSSSLVSYIVVQTYLLTKGKAGTRTESSRSLGDNRTKLHPPVASLSQSVSQTSLTVSYVSPCCIFFVSMYLFS